MMASKRAIRRRACSSKRGFVDHASATRALSAVHRNRGYQGLLTVYRCGFCKQYHFGHPPARVKRWMLK